MNKRNSLNPISHSLEHPIQIHPSKRVNLVQLPGISDSSMQKFLLEKRKRKLYLEYLIKEKNRIIGRSEIRKMHENLVIVKKKSVSKTEKLQKKNDAAVKIQKVAKGWLTRKKYEDDFILISRKVAESNIQDLKDNMPSILLFGKNCLNAVLKIQKTYRKYKTRQKILRLKHAYEITIQNNARTKAKRFMKKALKVFISKMIRFEAREMLEKMNVLFQIRVNLARLKIKNYFIRHKLSISSIIQTYQRAKWAKFGINLLEHKPDTSTTNGKPRNINKYARRYFKSYRPVLSQRNSRLLQPTQSSNSKTRIRLSPNLSFHKRNRSEFSLYSRPTRPSTPYRY